MTATPDSTKPTARHGQPTQGLVSLAFCTVSILVIWCIVLPYLASRESMLSYTQWLDQHGIDPSATYYTELEMMGPILHRLERQPGAHPVCKHVELDSALPQVEVP